MLIRTNILRRIGDTDDWEPTLIAIDFSAVTSIAVPVITKDGIRQQKWDWTEVRYRNGNKDILLMPFNQGLGYFVHAKMLKNRKSLDVPILDCMN